MNLLKTKTMKANVTVKAKLLDHEIEQEIEVNNVDTMKEELFELFCDQFDDISGLANEDEITAEEIEFTVSDWGDLADYENLQKESLFEEIADYNGYYDLDVLSAGIEADIEIKDIDEAYSGSFSDDEKFAEDMAEQLGYIPRDVSWPFTHIDWEGAARDLMMDYTEAKGFYFRRF